MSDAAYNSDSRIIEVKFDIYLGSGEPLHVTKDNYLVSSTILEEAQGNSQSVLDDVSSNEITLDLLNENNIFTPTNVNSPYYGQMKKDTVIRVFGRATTLDAEAEWEPLGLYYVKEWSSSSGSMIASITANDRMYNLFEAPTPVYSVKKNVTVRDLYKDFFTLLGMPYDVDDHLNKVLSYAYVTGTNKEFLSDLTKGALALCYCDRSSAIKVSSRLVTRPLRATLTDADQIIGVDAKQSIEAGYNGASVVCNTPQESSVKEVISIKDRRIKAGINTLPNLALSEVPLVRLSYAKVYTACPSEISSIVATPNDVSISLMSDDVVSNATISVAGTVLENVSSTLADTGNNLLALDSRYVQTEEFADDAIKYIRRIVGSKVPMLTVSTRGNFLLKLGDKVRVQSNRFSTDYTGIIVRNEYTYNGGLSCKLTLIDADLFKEVS